MFVKYTVQLSKRPYEDATDIRKLVPETMYSVRKLGIAEDEHVAFLVDFDGPLSADRFEILNIVSE